MALEGISKGFNTKTTRIDILNGVDFTILQGDTLAVCGGLRHW